MTARYSREASTHLPGRLTIGSSAEAKLIKTWPSSTASPAKITGSRGRGYRMWCSPNDSNHRMPWLSAPTGAAIPGAVGAHGIVGAEPGVQDMGYARGPNVFVRISVSL